MNQCVGPGEKFCARLCCSTALKNALKIKELNPQAEVTILYRDIRTYGMQEQHYRRARELGVHFIRFEAGAEPQVLPGARLTVREASGRLIHQFRYGASAEWPARARDARGAVSSL